VQNTEIMDMKQENLAICLILIKVNLCYKKNPVSTTASEKLFYAFSPDRSMLITHVSDTLETQ